MPYPLPRLLRYADSHISRQGNDPPDHRASHCQPIRADSSPTLSLTIPSGLLEIRAVSHVANPHDLPSQPEGISSVLAPNSPKRIAPRRKISLNDIESIADLCVKRLTETEACKLLDINPQCWFDWKGRNSNVTKFSDALMRLKAGKINACMEGIQAAGARDWRALDRTLQLTDARFRESANDSKGLIVVDTSILDALKRVYADTSLSQLPAPSATTLPPASQAEKLIGETTSQKPGPTGIGSGHEKPREADASGHGVIDV